MRRDEPAPAFPSINVLSRFSDGKLIGLHGFPCARRKDVLLREPRYLDVGVYYGNPDHVLSESSIKPSGTP